MQVSAILTTLALAATALAACPNGPYSEGGSCAGACEGAQRCSKNTDHVVRIRLDRFARWPVPFAVLQFFNFALYIFVSCIPQTFDPIPLAHNSKVYLVS